jgi:hypothetical protein
MQCDIFFPNRTCPFAGCFYFLQQESAAFLRGSEDGLLSFDPSFRALPL